MSEVVNLAVAGASLLTAFAALWIILEVRRQREATYKPRLVIPSRRILVREVEGHIEQADEAKVPFRDGYSLELQNLGFGSAVDVVVQWRIDYQEIVRRIQKMPASSLFAIKDVGWIEIKSSTNKLPLDFVSTRTEAHTCFDHVQPISADPQKHRIEIPALLENLLRVFLFLSWNMLSEDFPRDQLEEVQKLAQLPVSLGVEYSDIAGRKYRTHGNLLTETRFSFAGIEHGEQWIDYVTCSLGAHLA